MPRSGRRGGVRHHTLKIFLVFLSAHNPIHIPAACNLPPFMKGVALGGCCRGRNTCNTPCQRASPLEFFLQNRPTKPLIFAAEFFIRARKQGLVQ
jgi:hypothetical protein